jgi:guanidinopropionase
MRMTEPREATMPSSEDVMRDLYWWGPPTLFRCPHDPDPVACDIGLVGVPHSSGNGTTWHDQHLGPRAIRDLSMGYRRRHARWGLDPWDALRIHDLGDVFMPNFLVNDVTIREIEAFYRKLDEAGTRPVSIGGDHAIPLAILRAIAGPEARTTAGRPAALVHFDAHYDTYDDFPSWYGVTDSAGHWASRSVHEHHVEATRSVQIGIRGHGYGPDDGHTSRELGYRIVDKDEFDELGVPAVIELTRERVGDLPVYVSFDLDVLDMSIAPAVSNPEPGEEGLTMKQAIRVIQGLRGLDVIGADVVEIMPSKDGPAQVTGWNATRIAFELVCLVADSILARR